MTEHKLQFVKDILSAEELDVLIIFGLPNMRYLCGFTGTDGVFLMTAEKSIFLTDSRYLEQAQNQVHVDQIHSYKSKLQAVIEQLAILECHRIGFDAESVSVATYDELTGLAVDNLQWHPLSLQLKPLRGIKTAAELAALKAAADLNRQAFSVVLPQIKSGISERQIALELELTLKRLGGEANAFDFIVASGVRGALPHGVATAKKLQEGELVTIDFGTRVAGYHSDETVTLAICEVDGKLRQIFDIVLEAHELALAFIRPEMAVCDLDAVARDFISSAGYGEYFGHGLGHGVGLEIHEYPAITSRSDQKLCEGMVFTVEPGVYLPNVGGVRIEDTIVVTADGYELLTSIPKQFNQLDG